MTNPLHIAVVGCGIAGTTCALMLARGGRRVTLFEQTDHVGPVGAGVLLQPSGQAVLAEMGLLDELLPKVERIEMVHAVTERGRDLVRLRYPELRGDLFGAGLHRGDLFSLLHGRLEAAGVQLLLGTPIIGVRDIDSAPVAIDAAGRSHGPFDLLIAADGSRSRLRAACGIPARVTEYRYGALWAVADVAPVRGKLYQAARGTEELGGMLPIGGDRCSLFWGLRADRIADFMKRGFGPWRDDVLRLMPSAQPLVDRIGSLEATRFVTYRRVTAPRLWRGKVVFIGDAAHAMSPHLGQGVNLALLDAQALAQAIERSPAPEQAFAHYAAKRRRAIRYYAGVTAFLAPFFQSHGRVFGWGRNIALPLMCGLPPVRRMMLRTMSGLE